ncbi:hypothetical protein Misp01_74600 [Microtetraspora sp. NBRC 13810]|nr:hypothetical protein Misp01_74600 [Microtetraspora sp. NBRC 13810]
MLLAVLLVVGGTCGAGWFWLGPVSGSAAETSRAYLDAWRRGDYAAMSALVAEPPADFADRHRRLDRDLRVESIALTPGTIVRRGDEAADIRVQGVRQVRELGAWPFSTTLRLAVRGRVWKVLWSPETLHPALAGGAALKLTETRVPTTELVTRTGERMPNDNGAESYLGELNRRLDRTTSGWAIDQVREGVTRRLVVYQPPPTSKVRTTLSWRMQAAAARALDGVRQPATIVAVRASTGEVLAVADRLGAGRRAFEEVYGPGDAFMLVTAAALLSDGLTPDSRVACPGEYTPPARAGKIENAGGTAPGTVSLAKAMSLSCATTFAQQAVERLTPDELAGQAESLGFGRELGSGVGGTCGRPPAKSANRSALATDAVGRNTVAASPLCMALLAAAVKDGTWRPPRLVTEKAARVLDRVRPNEVTVPPAVASGLRTMMQAEAAEEANAGLFPKGVAGHAGRTPDVGTWFVGYRQDMAFAVFVKGKGPVRRAALPIASRFLRAL